MYYLLLLFILIISSIICGIIISHVIIYYFSFLIIGFILPIKYYIIPSKTNPEFILETRIILLNSNINNKFKIKEVFNEQDAHIIIALKSRKSLDKYHDKIEYYKGTDKVIRFSFTWQYPKPYIAIDKTSWTYGISESGLSLSEYRQYVIQHEFMHGLGYDHQLCNEETTINKICPILYQATRGPPKGFSAGYSVTPIDYTKKIKGSYF